MEPITLLIAIIAVLATGYSYFRSSAVKVWEQNTAAYRARVEVLEQANKELLTKISWMDQRIHELESRPNWEQVVAVISVTERNILHAISEMQAAALQQHKAALVEITAQQEERARVRAREA